MKFEYKVVNFKANVMQGDLDDGSAPGKVAGQLESLFEDHANQGLELQGQYDFPVEIEAGCLASLLALIPMLGAGSTDQTIQIEMLVFKRPV